MPFRLRTKQLFLTYPQCPIHKEDALTLLEGIFPNIEEYIVAHELHANGDDHLHVYLKLKEGIDTQDKNFANLLQYHGNYQGCRSNKNVIKYCTKKDDYISNINVEEVCDARKNKRKTLAKELVEGKSVEELVEDNPELIFGYKKLKMDVNEYRLDKALKEPVSDEPIKGYWLWGAAGTGKSMLARLYQPFEKAQNKWWDGYKGEEYVLIDDVDSKQLGHLFKIWGDPYGKKTGEVKGGAIPLRYKTIIITSNYSIEELFVEDNNLISAIKRRFISLYFGNVPNVCNSVYTL